MNCNEIQKKLEKERCPVCGKSAKISFVNSSFKFEACCPKFGEYLQDKTKILLNNQIESEIQNTFKNLGGTFKL